MAGITLYQVDAFTNVPFGGNPAAVALLLKASLPKFTDALRQDIAAEMNLSETAFLECQDDSDDFTTCSVFKLRWFTPAIEVPLCGHATLASAAALFFGQHNTAETLRFNTLSGELQVSKHSSGGLYMSLPLLPPTDPLPNESTMGIGSDLIHATVSELPVKEVVYCKAVRYLVIVLEKQEGATRAAFEGIAPDVARMHAAHQDGRLVGVVITMQGDGVEHDFYSRFFGPWAGIPEDPVTGSAHSVLGPYWAQVLGKQTMKARQCSKRGGELVVEVSDSDVKVIGGAAIVFKGELLC